MSTIRLAIAGVGNCASSLVQGIQYYQDADPDDDVPGLMHVELGGYHVRDVEVVAAFDVDADKVGIDVAKAIHAGPNNTIRFAEVPDLASPCSGARPSTASASSTPGVRGVAGRAGRRGRGAARRRAPTCWCPTCRSAPSRPRSTTPRPASTPAWPSSTPSRCSSPPTPSGRRVRRGRRADRRRRHQVPGRGHHRAPHAGPAVRGPRHHARPHVPAELRREHGLHEHARALAAEVEEDLEDPVGHEPDRGRHQRPRRAHRPVRSRAVARGPQVGVHPPGGPQLRRRAAQRSSSSSRCTTRPTRPASSSTPSAAPSSPSTAGSAARLGPSAYFMKSPPIQVHDDVARDALDAFIGSWYAWSSAGWSGPNTWCADRP